MTGWRCSSAGSPSSPSRPCVPMSPASSRRSRRSSTPAHPADGEPRRGAVRGARHRPRVRPRTAADARPTSTAATSCWPPTSPRAPRRSRRSSTVRTAPSRWRASTTTPPTSRRRSTGPSTRGRRAIAVELVLASVECWIAAGRHNEALDMTLRVLDHVPQQGPEAARLMAAAPMLSHQLGDQDRALDYGRSALELAERHGDRPSAAAARTFLGATLVFAGEIDRRRRARRSSRRGGRGSRPLPAVDAGPLRAGDGQGHRR